MIQALPLVESGAADAFGLTSEQLALACASHQGGEHENLAHIGALLRRERIVAERCLFDVQ